MSAAAPDPAPQATRSFGLLVLVRALIDYGRELTATLRQHGTTALGFSVRHFGTDDVALILARITHGLHLAAALERASPPPRPVWTPTPSRTAPRHTPHRAPREPSHRETTPPPRSPPLSPGLTRGSACQRRSRSPRRFAADRSAR